jgi:hypothetical protein
VFHEIDMTASEGYRRIPHGGIEVGGVLFGRRLPDGVRIEGFRPIECEHAQGPSFKLSERDAAGIREQIERAPIDPELGGMEVLGWFVAHTRGPLQMTEAEARLFGELFPGPGRLTVLVKPEKFKPTLFAFLVRSGSGVVKSDGVNQAIILPLPGRAGRGFESVPAAPIFVPAPEPVREPVSEHDTKHATERPAEPILPRPEPVPEPAAHPVRVSPPPPSLEVPRAVPPVTPPPVPAPPPAPPPFQWDFDRSPSEPAPPLFGEYGQSGGRKVRRDVTQERPGASRVLTAVFVAAILGAGAGFWFYQQMPPPLIQLTVEPQPTGVVVSWPPDQTSDSAHAFVRVNNGPLTELPPEAKASGRYQVLATPDNLKVEIVAQHALHDSRGIVRYIQPATAR